MSLDTYRKKRNFTITPEPRGMAAKRKGSDLRFVVQKHAARRLHYDFRLELNGVLLSWAVPKGPSLDPNDKRLAIHVEDHPLEYGDFEGVIPPKQYGSGTVMLWDRGTWIPKEDPLAGYNKGKLKFELRGEKLHGGWSLVKSRGGKYGGDKAWLLFKEDDEHARPGLEAQVVDQLPRSVTSRRSLKEITANPRRLWDSHRSVAEALKPSRVKKIKTRINLAQLAAARKASMPDFVSPQLATLSKTVPRGEGWIHEVKYDGYRMLCHVNAGAIRVFSRNRKDWTQKFPSIVRAVSVLPLASAWLDGEIVSLDAQGRSSFQTLQNALSTGAAEVIYYVFDLPYLNGYDLRGVALEKRKAILKRLLNGSGAVRYSEHFDVPGPKFFTEVCKLGLEGMISKRSDSTYQGVRSLLWLKLKCGLRQEFIIGGFTDPEGRRPGFGALLLGVYDGERNLRYCGKVGTGFKDSFLVEMRKILDGLRQSASPFSNPPRGAEGRRAHWVKPELVAEVSFTEWTRDGTLRNPSFLGLREDKPPLDVVREEPTHGTRVRSRHAATSASKPPKLAQAANGDKDSIAGIQLTNPDKLLFPEAGLTKRDLALYFVTIASWIVPHLYERPLTLLRCPDGWNKPCFYQKHADDNVPGAITRVTVRDSEGPSLYMMANSTSAVVALVQMGALEIHPWGSRTPKLGRPDRIIFDLDPDEAVGWDEISEAAKVMKTLLDHLGLRVFLKTTGGKGLHLVIPIRPTQPWKEIKGFSQSVAQLLVNTFPDRFTAKILRASRRGKIFIDYLRNAEGATAIAPYSIRARAHAPIATPIDWSELASDVRFDHFKVANLPARLNTLKSDPWADLTTIKQSVTRAMMKAVGYRR